jgi:hypothetical protein
MRRGDVRQMVGCEQGSGRVFSRPSLGAATFGRAASRCSSSVCRSAHLTGIGAGAGLPPHEQTGGHRRVINGVFRLLPAPVISRVLTSVLILEQKHSEGREGAIM